MASINTVHELRGNIQDAIDYILDEEKTDWNLVGCTNCANPSLAGTKWKITNNQSKSQNGLFNDKNGVVGYHFINSFEKGSITPEECFELSKEWIEKCTNNQYDYVISVHTNTDHIHAHIIVNSVNRETGNKWNLFFKTELNKFKQYNNEVLKEHGIEPLSDVENSKSNSWYKHFRENRGDDHESLLVKTLDYLVTKVETYEQLKLYLQKIGYEIEDGSQQNVENSNLKDDIFHFTLNKKMVNGEFTDEYSYFVRLPYTQDYIQIPNENAFWDDNNITLKCQMNINDVITVYDSKANITKESTGKDILKTVEEKNVEKRGRQGLRIKPPHSKYFKKCKYLTNVDNPDLKYSLDDIKERINSNKNYEADNHINMIINTELDETQKRKEQNNFYEKADIKTKYNQSIFYKMTKYEKYKYIRSQEIQKLFDHFSEKSDIVADSLNIDELKKLRMQIKKELGEINQELRDLELDFKDLLGQKLEGIIDMTDTDEEKWIASHITPLRQEKLKLKKQAKELDNRINKAISVER